MPELSYAARRECFWNATSPDWQPSGHESW